MTQPALHVRPIGDADREEIAQLLTERWGSAHIVTRARTHEAGTLPGFVARDDAGAFLGATTLSVEHRDCEIVTIDAVTEGRGVGTNMLAEAERWAKDQGCDRMWLVTTNANLRALYFYQIRGYRIIAVHRDAVVHSRELQPDLPQVAANGIHMLDELELEKEI
jgi:GNAT superfamily N-acetyltransferase